MGIYTAQRSVYVIFGNPNKREIDAIAGQEYELSDKEIGQVMSGIFKKKRTRNSQKSLTLA